MASSDVSASSSSHSKVSGGTSSRDAPPPPETLTVLEATSIAGNDMLSSCLYSAGSCMRDAGVFAPLCMALVSVTMYLFRSVYGEAVSVLPLNGGAYSVLVNNTWKSTAAMCATLTFISYVATSVVSAAEAIVYAHHLWSGINVEAAALGVLVIFALLCFLGLGESARVAMIIFTFNMVTLVTLLISCIVYGFQHNGWPQAKLNYGSSHQGGFFISLVWGFASAMLGVTGFETAANFVEETERGGFKRVLRNLWGCSTFLNVLLTLAAACTLRLDDVVTDRRYQESALAYLADTVGGEWLKTMVCIDGFIVLAGSVLTGFVGVVGLWRRLALDGLAPQFFLIRNQWRGTHHWIILCFLFLTCSIYLILNGSVYHINQVYCIAFLVVMILFVIGNALIKIRVRLSPIADKLIGTKWIEIAISFILVFTALVVNLIKDPTVIAVFLLYFVVVAFVMLGLIYRLRVTASVYQTALKLRLRKLASALNTYMQDLERVKTICFVKRPSNLREIQEAINYILHNEDSKCMTFIHIRNPHAKEKTEDVNIDIDPKAKNMALLSDDYDDDDDDDDDMDNAERPLLKQGSSRKNHEAAVAAAAASTTAETPGGRLYTVEQQLRYYVSLLQRQYPEMRFDTVVVDGVFGPDIITQIELQLAIPRNNMFMAWPRENVGHSIAVLGGVRLIPT